MMRRAREKLVYRYSVVDDQLKTWAVLDKETGQKVEEDITDPQYAKELAERLNREHGEFD